MNLDVEKIRNDFPILRSNAEGHRLHYLDSGASSQKPSAVLDAMTTFYETTYANVHRGVYAISEEATARYEGTRKRIAQFVNAYSEKEIIFTKNVTEAFNLLVQSWGRKHLSSNDVVLLTELEHHADIVPWQILQSEIGFTIRFIPVDQNYELDLTALGSLLAGVKILSVSAMSNVLGTKPPLAQLIAAAHDAGALVAVDAAQWVPHYGLDVRTWDADFVGFTGHKLLGPTGIGVLWGRRELLEVMPPFMGGGDMISDVRLDGFIPNELPWKFEAGTPPIAEVIGLGAAIDYLESIGFDSITAHENELMRYTLDALDAALGDDITIFGPTDLSKRGGVISFALRDVHPHDVAQILDSHHVCVRAGHHCAKPLMRKLGVNATARASLYLYNDTEDIDALVNALLATREMFA